MPMNVLKQMQNFRSVGLAMALIAGAAHAEAARGPFATFPGAWSGDGSISMTSGAVERLRCKADYSLDDGGATLMQSLDCTSDSYTFQLKNQVQATGSDVAGQWIETTRHAQGTVAGKVAGGRIEGTVTGPGFTATFSLQAHASQQQVLIKVQGGDIAQISASLTRGH